MSHFTPLHTMFTLLELDTFIASLVKEEKK